MTVTRLDLAIKLFGPRYTVLPSGLHDFYDVGVLYNAAPAEIVIGKTTVPMDDFVHGVTERTKQNGGNGRKNLAQHIAEMRAYNPPPDPPEPPADPIPQPRHDNKAATRPELKPVRDEAGRYLTALDPTTDRFTFQTFDDNKERKKARAEANKLRKQQGKPELKDPLARVRHGTLAEHWNELVELNNKGAGIYITINVTKLKGRRTKENI